MKRPVLIIFFVLLVDQVLKLWIKTHMYLGQEFRIADWFYIHFTENNGMAFGMEFAGENGKLILSLFRIIAVSGIGYYLYTIVKHQASGVLITSMALIFAGAMGNIIDSTFYGVMFSGSEFQVAEFFPPEGGYASFLHGRVVDMFYFPIIEGYLPDWVPFWGGDYVVFFRPVFNVADSSITIGVILLIFYQSFIHPKERHQQDVTEAEEQDEKISNDPDERSITER